MKSQSTTTLSSEEVNRFVARRLASSWGKRREATDGRELHRLISLVRDDDWPPGKGWIAVMERLSSHPEEALICDNRGRTPLMAAYEKAVYAPRPVLQAILNQTKFGIETDRDKTGMTALWIAMQAQAPLKSIQLLLERRALDQIMTTNHQGNLPLHSAVTRSHRRRSLVILSDDASRRTALVQLFLSRGPSSQVLYENSKGQTPLHVALENRLSARIIELLLEAEPKVVSRRACGYTPLIAAIRAGASYPVLRMLVQADPDTTQICDSDGKYPIRLVLEQQPAPPDPVVIRLLVGGAKRAVRAEDSCGRNCFDLVLEQWSTAQSQAIEPQVLSILLETDPTLARHNADCEDGTSCYRACRLSPVQHCYRDYAAAVHTLDSIRKRAPLNLPTSRNLMLQAEVEVCDKRWEICRMVLEAATRRNPGCDDNDDTWSPLCAALTTGAPAPFLRRVLDRWPESRSACDPVTGRYPLHLACALDRSIREKSEIVELLLVSEPTMACRADREGRLPLNIATECGGVQARVLAAMVHAYPAAVRKLDSKFGLYPYQVEALMTGDSDKNSVGATFSLLQAAPDLLNC